jgi:hypothetical protein
MRYLSWTNLRIGAAVALGALFIAPTLVGGGCACCGAGNSFLQRQTPSMERSTG